MKFTAVLLASAAAVAVAQDLSSLPACGQTCIQNMLGLAGTLGCQANDVRCLCSNANFGYGVRDCSNQACKDQGDAARVIQYGTNFCAGIISQAQSASASLPASALSVLSSAAATIGGPAASGQTPIATSFIVSVVTVSGGSSYTTVIGQTTIYGAVSSAAGSAASGVSSAIASVTGSAASAASGAASSAQSAASGAASSAQSAASGAVSSAQSAASNAASSAGAAASSRASGAASSALSSARAAAAHPTAGPILGVAGLAALLFV